MEKVSVLGTNVVDNQRARISSKTSGGEEVSDEDIGDMDYGECDLRLDEGSVPGEAYLCKSVDGDRMLHVKDEKDGEQVVSVKQIIQMKKAINKLIKKVNLCEDCPERYRRLTNGGGCCMMEDV
jgi:hypothetical protein